MQKVAIVLAYFISLSNFLFIWDHDTDVTLVLSSQDFLLAPSKKYRFFWKY